MTLYDTSFWNVIDNARAELGGGSYFDHENGVEYNFPAKDYKKHSKAYDYCYIAMHSFMNLADAVDEIKLIEAQIQHSQDFAFQHKEFSTDFILNFSYKNWIIRINIIAEQLILLVNHVYSLHLPEKDLINQIFEHEKVKKEKTLYFGLLNMIDFLHEKILHNVNNKSLKKTRNEIVHHANFKHNLIENLSFQLFEFRYGLSGNMEDEDVYLTEGQASEKIKMEIREFTSKFLEKFKSIYDLFAEEFLKHFYQILKVK